VQTVRDVEEIVTDSEEQAKDALQSEVSRLRDQYEVVERSI